MRWRTERKGDAWVVFDPSGTAWTQAASREEAKALLIERARLSMAAPERFAPTATRPFETLATVEGRWTGDERLIMVDGLSWDGLLPFPLTSDHGADCDEIVGRVDELERVPGATADERFIIGRGVLDISDELGQSMESKIEGEFLKGVSVDIDDIDIGGVDPETVEDPEDIYWLQVVESARIRALALCAIPAFAEAYITLGTVDTATPVPAIDGPVPLPADEVPEPEMPEDIIVIASGHTVTIPDVPPAEWFTEPTDVSIEGALTVTDEGRVYGLLAPGGVGHIGRADRMMAPMGNVNYSAWMRGETPVEGGGRVVTGNITMSCGHAGPSLASGPTAEHYDNSCSLVVTAAAGECAAGTWVAGALLPGVTADQVRRMMSLQLSGDWRPNDHGGYDLCGALLVPVPGYGMARRAPSVTVKDGVLVASAVPVKFVPSGVDEPLPPSSLGPGWYDHLTAGRRFGLRASGDCGCGDESAARIEALEATVRRLEAERLTAKLRMPKELSNVVLKRLDENGQPTGDELRV